MAVILQVNFPMQGPWGDEMASTYAPLAETINEEPGFIWKVWIEDQAAQTAGGIDLFEDRATAEAYADMHSKRMAGFGVSDAVFVISDTNPALSEITHGRLTAG